MPAARTRAPGHLLLSQGALSLPSRHATPQTRMDQSLPPSLSPSPVPRHGRSLHGRTAAIRRCHRPSHTIQLCHELRLDPHVLCTNPGTARSSVTTTPSSSSSSDPWITAIDSPDLVPPLPRQQHQKNCGEPLHRFPNAPLPNLRPS